MAKLEVLKKDIVDNNNNVISTYEVYPRTSTLNIYDSQGRLLDVVLKTIEDKIKTIGVGGEVVPPLPPTPPNNPPNDVGTSGEKEMLEIDIVNIWDGVK